MRFPMSLLASLLAFVPMIAQAQIQPAQACPVESNVFVQDRPEATYLAVRSQAPGVGFAWDFRFENIVVSGASISLDAIPLRPVVTGFIGIPWSLFPLGALPPGDYTIVIRPSIASGACPTITRTHTVAGVAYQYVPVPSLGTFASWLLAVLMLLAASPVLRHRLARG